MRFAAWAERGAKHWPMSIQEKYGEKGGSRRRLSSREGGGYQFITSAVKWKKRGERPYRGMVFKREGKSLISIRTEGKGKDTEERERKEKIYRHRGGVREGGGGRSNLRG